MRFYFQSLGADGQKVATKCIRVSNTATTEMVIEALVQKFRPDMRMLTHQSSYALYEVHSDEGMCVCIGCGDSGRHAEFRACCMMSGQTVNSISVQKPYMARTPIRQDLHTLAVAHYEPVSMPRV